MQGHWKISWVITLDHRRVTHTNQSKTAGLAFNLEVALDWVSRITRSPFSNLTPVWVSFAKASNIRIQDYKTNLLAWPILQARWQIKHIINSRIGRSSLLITQGLDSISYSNKMTILRVCLGRITPLEKTWTSPRPIKHRLALMPHRKRSRIKTRCKCFSSMLSSTEIIWIQKSEKSSFTRIEDQSKLRRIKIRTLVWIVGLQRLQLGLTISRIMGFQW